MADKYPEDEFDRLAAQRTTVGAHRKPRSARPWIIGLVAVLVLAPLLGVFIGNVISDHESPQASKTASTEVTTDAAPPAEGDGADDGAETPGADAAGDAIADPSAEPTDDVAQADLTHQVIVLNGRGVAGYAAENQSILIEQGFTNTLAGDYRGGADPAESTIYFQSAEYEGSANAIAEALGISNIVESPDVTTAYGIPLVVIVR